MRRNLLTASLDKDGIIRTGQGNNRRARRAWHKQNNPQFRWLYNKWAMRYIASKLWVY